MKKIDTSAVEEAHLISTMNFFYKLLKAQGKEYVYPVSPFIHTNFVKAFFKDDKVDVITRTPEVYNYFGFALIHRNCTPEYNPIGMNTETWQVKEEVLTRGDDIITTYTIYTPEGILKQIYKKTRVSVYDYEESPVEYLIKNKNDFELCKKYLPAPEKIDISPVGSAIKASGSYGVVAPWIQGAFNFVAFYFCRLDSLLMWAITEEILYREIMEYFLQRNIRYINQVLEAGPDLVSYAANIANGKMVSAEFYLKFIWEYEKRLIDHIQTRNAGVLFHNCGYAAKLLPLYAQLGPSVYESLTPFPYGDTILEDALSTFKKETVLSGNIDQIDLLRQGTIEEIEQQTREVVDTVHKSGREYFVVSTTDYFSEDTPWENINAFKRGAKGG